jgi:hypothetical protein
LTDQALYVVDGFRVTPDTEFTTGARLRGRSRRLAVKYLLLRDGNRCAIRRPGCTNPDGFADPMGADIHHLDGRNERGHHIAKNLVLACHSCNSSENASKAWGALTLPPPPPSTPFESVRKDGVAVRSGPVGPAPASKETQLKPIYRESFDAWKALPETWTKLGKAIGRPVQIGDWVLLDDFVSFAVGELKDDVEGKPSSQTIKRYCDEDRLHELELLKDKGRRYIRYRLEFKPDSDSRK